MSHHYSQCNQRPFFSTFSVLCVTIYSLHFWSVQHSCGSLTTSMTFLLPFKIYKLFQSCKRNIYLKNRYYPLSIFYTLIIMCMCHILYQNVLLFPTISLCYSAFHIKLTLHISKPRRHKLHQLRKLVSSL